MKNYQVFVIAVISNLFCFLNATKKRVLYSFQSGSSPLLVASYKGNVEVVRTLLKYHARVDVFDEVVTITL